MPMNEGSKHGGAGSGRADDRGTTSVPPVCWLNGDSIQSVVIPKP
jgi:hypothetical protein